MISRFRFSPRALVALLAITAGGCAMLAPKPAPEQAQDLDRQALEAYRNNDLPAAKEHLERAIALAEEEGLADRAMARRHLTLGVVFLGLGDRDRSLGQFGLALHLQPGIDMPPELNRPGARKALATARAQLKRRKGPAATAVAEAKREKARAARAKSEVRVESVHVTASPEKPAPVTAPEPPAKPAKPEPVAHAARPAKPAKPERAPHPPARPSREPAVAAHAPAPAPSPAHAPPPPAVARTPEPTPPPPPAREPAPPARPPVEAKAPARAPEVASAPPPEPAHAPPTAVSEDEIPDLPASIPEPLYCPIADETLPDADVTFRCVPEPGLSIAHVVLFYRSAGSETFTTVPMARSRKGWYEGVVPAQAVVGKSLQYYVEGQSSARKVLYTDGTSDSPNLMSIRTGARQAGQGALAAARFNHESPDEKDDENPLLESARAKEREAKAAAIHHRRPVTVWLGVGAGSGYGWHPSRTLEFRNDKAAAAGASSGGLVQIEPELGLQLGPRFGVAVQARYQIVPESGSGELKEGTPPHSAFAVFLHGYRFYGSGNWQGFLSATVGGGQGFRLLVPPTPAADLPRSDTIRGGPVVLGPGAGGLYHMTTHFAWALEGRLLIGAPDLAALLEVSTGPQLAF